MNQTQYYYSCDYELVGDCSDCTEMYPGNWWSALEEEGETCCTPTRFIRKKILYQVNKTSDCPGLLTQAGRMMPWLLGCAGAIGLGLAAYGIYRCIKKRQEVNQENRRNPSAAASASRADDAGIEWIELHEFQTEGSRGGEQAKFNDPNTGENDADNAEYEDRETVSVKSVEEDCDDGMKVNVDIYAGAAKMWTAEKDYDDEHIYEELFFLED